MPWGFCPTMRASVSHDGLKSYASYACEHALCNAHHLRELTFILERYQQIWAEEMSILLCDLKQQVDDACQVTMPLSGDDSAVGGFDDQL